MKTAIIVIFLIPAALFSQINDRLIVELNTYANSIDNLISNSTGAPGEVYSNSVTVQRNVRAIGMQNTKITFYYIQKDDSVYEDKEGTAYFIPQYNPPLMIMVEYNIANSQTVIAKYYFNGENYLYDIDSRGAYGNSARTFWLGSNNLLRFRNAQNEMEVIIESGKFSKDVYNESLNILDRIKDYTKLYYDIFSIEHKDK